MADPKARLNTEVTVRSKRGWDDFADSYHANVSVLIEAFGLALGEFAQARLHEDELPAGIGEILGSARAIAATRRRRPRA